MNPPIGEFYMGSVAKVTPLARRNETVRAWEQWEQCHRRGDSRSGAL